MGAKLSQSVLYNFAWEYGESLVGFIINQNQQGWTLINNFDSDLTLNGYYLINNNVITSLEELDKCRVASRLQCALRVEAIDPAICHDSIKLMIDQIALKWRVVGIYTKAQGYDELEIGIISNVVDDHFIYRFVSTEGFVDTNVSKVKFEDILLLSFGGRYEVGLDHVIAYDRNHPPRN